jgi:hypothetical protein
MINTKLDKLLDKLDPAHKIILNEKGLMIIKLHDNKKFTKWLNDNNIMPQIKAYHSTENTTKYGVQHRNSGSADPFFITLGIIPQKKNNDKSEIKISCCELDVQRLGNIIFKDDNSSGFMFNGSYFFMENHISDQMYGIHGNKDIFQNKKKFNENEKSFHYKPVGHFRYDTNPHGLPEFSPYNYNSTYDGYSLENVYVTNKKNKQGAYIKSDLTLDIINDSIGFAVFDNNNNTAKIIKFSDFPNPQKITKNYFNEKKNVVMGNLLVNNGQVVMTEEKMAIAILLFAIPELNLLMYDKIYLCNSSYNKLTGNEIVNLIFGSDVHFVSYNEPNIRGKIVYDIKHIYMPYCFHFLKKAYSTGSSGKVPPGYPIHASDLNPRTCIMIDNNDNFIVMNVEGRNKVCGGIGIDLFDLAKLCEGMGAKYALNLDGGASSKLLWKEKNNSINYVGHFDESKPYKISNAIFVV